MEGDLIGVRLAEAGEHLHAPLTRHRRNLAHQTAFPNTGWSDHPGHRAMAVDGAVQKPLDRAHLPSATDQFQLSTFDRSTMFCHAQQPMGGYWLAGPLDVDQLALAESRCVLNQACGGRADH